jgi:hemolysin III
VYALRHPDPVPAVFGYHEVFHLLVIAGVAAHFLAISLYVLPKGRTALSRTQRPGAVAG